MNELETSGGGNTAGTTIPPAGGGKPTPEYGQATSVAQQTHEPISRGGEADEEYADQLLDTTQQRGIDHAWHELANGANSKDNITPPTKPDKENTVIAEQQRIIQELRDRISRLEKENDNKQPADTVIFQTKQRQTTMPQAA